jgi:nucleoside-diphosphate-sugar epimerase
MNVFVAGGTGTIGVPLVSALVAAGHQVTALTRSAGKRDDLRALGAAVAVADALDRDALMAAVQAAHPTHVVHQLTALPKDGPRRASDVAATNRLRTDGTRNLLEAAVRAGAGRFVAGSFALLAPRDPGSAAPADPAAAAVHSMEAQVLEATEQGAIEGVILRYGMFYGPHTASTDALIRMVRRRLLPVVSDDAGQLPFVHIDDAVSATVRALQRGAPGGAYDIVDDRPVSFGEVVRALAEFSGSPAPLRVPGWLLRLASPYLARLLTIRLPLSNARAKADLGWQPSYPTVRDGLARMFRALRDEP